MKKILLFGIAVLASASMSAQTVVWPCQINRAEKTANVSATVTGSTTIKASDIVMGTDIEINKKDDAPAPAAVKDETGANLNYPSDDFGMIAWKPITGNAKDSDGNLTHDESTADAAVTQNAYLDFTVEESDTEKDLTGLTSITFDATKVGTDAIRLNCKLLYEGDGEGESEWLINQEVANSFGDEYNGDANDKTDPFDDNANGYNPSRNDGSKGAAGGANQKGISKVKLTMPDAVKALNPYKLTLRIAIIGCANNKQLALNNVTFNFGGEAAINTIKAEAQDGAIYNVAGQKVGANYKGLVIKNGKKTIQ